MGGQPPPLGSHPPQPGTLQTKAYTVSPERAQSPEENEDDDLWNSFSTELGGWGLGGWGAGSWQRAAGQERQRAKRDEEERERSQKKKVPGEGQLGAAGTPCMTN